MSLASPAPSVRRLRGVGRVDRAPLSFFLACVACATCLAAGAGCGGSGPPRGPCAEAKPLGSVCGFANPEDVAHAPAAGVIVSGQMRRGDAGGELLALVPGATTPRRVWPTGTPGDFARDPSVGDPACAPPDPTKLAPHGVYVGSDGRLYAVNHGGRESIEIFSLGGTGDGASLAWLGCVVLPAGTAGNDLAVAPDGELVVSNFMPDMESSWGRLKLALGWKTGDVLAWRRDGGWRHIPGTEASGPNGIEISPDGRFIFYTETGGARVVRIARDGSNRTEAPVPGLPDNLSWTSRGTLYLPAHKSSTGFLGCMRGNACRAPWTLYEIDPETLRVTEVVDDGEVVGAVASAAEVGPRVFLGAVFGDRIGVWTRP